MNESNASWKLLAMAAMLPILVLVAIDVSMGGGFADEDFK